MHLWYIERLTCPSYHTVICQFRNNLPDAKPLASKRFHLGNHSQFGWFWLGALGGSDTPQGTFGLDHRAGHFRPLRIIA